VSNIEEVKAKLSSIDELPALPTIVAEINDLLSDYKTTAPQLARVIMRDPAITARVLKIVNSAFFGFPKRIESVNQAIIALGFNTVRSIVLCSSVMEAFSAGGNKADALSRKEFWKFSVTVAAACKVVARNAGEKKTEAAFVNGLLHGVGKLVLDQFFHDSFTKALKQARAEGRILWEVQREVLGVTDAEVGGVLLGMWKLSEGLQVCVSHQENPLEAPEEHRAGAAQLLVSNALARIVGGGDPGDAVLPRLSPEVLALCAIDEPQWPRLLELTVDEAKKASVFFELA
jgi:HD-like signal output (HDOD) protein